MSGRIRIVIVDDDALVRAGLTLLLGGAADLEIVGEAGDGIEALDVVRRQAPDVVLMDIRMPRRDGIAATTALLREPRPPRVLVLTTFDTDELVLAALRAGASGFLLKDTPPARMVEAIRAVASGEATLSPSVMEMVIAAATAGTGEQLRRTQARRDLDRLTDREREVAVEVARGATNAEIAGALSMSVATVKAHVSHVFAKLGTDNRVRVAMLVRDADLPRD
jgi:DNA-binding NarL/FixJ family response regulator